MRLAFVVALCSGMLACNQTTGSSSLPDGSFAKGWTVVATGTTANLNAISGLSDKAFWVVGDRGTIGHWNGTTLALEKSGTTANLHSVFALDANDAWAVGDGGTILQRTAAGWKVVGAGTTRQVLTGVWADTTRVVAVGSNGTVILGGTTGYQIIKNPYSQNLFSVTGTPGGAVTAVGSLGLMIQLSGTTVSRVTLTPPGGGEFLSLLTGAATGPSNSYFVGQQGTVFRSDGAGLNQISGNAANLSNCPGTALRAVSIVGTVGWIVGWDGTICEINGPTATSFPYSDTRWFNGIYAASAKSLWIVGASGTLLHGFPDNPDGGPPPSDSGADVADVGGRDGGGP
jgi:photosystem II stability/assembly factor-like uncharacterized protein